LSWLEKDRPLGFAEMVNYFVVSKMITTHRDLDLLEQRQILKRIHGELIDSIDDSACKMMEL
jgi:DeoR/GlpR family transcriptional regulator of sugar metabolism